MLQVCEERLQFSLCENVKTNVLWGSSVKDTVMLRPWGEQITENSAELVTVKEQKEDERYDEHEPILNSIGSFHSNYKYQTIQTNLRGKLSQEKMLFCDFDGLIL